MIVKCLYESMHSPPYIRCRDLGEIKTEREILKELGLVISVEERSKESEDTINVLVLEVLEEILADRKLPLEVRPVKPLTKTDSGVAIRELRKRRLQ